MGVTSLAGLPIWLLSAFAPSISRETGFDSSTLGVTVGAFFFGVSALVGIMIGRLVQRVGWRTGVAAASAVTAVACIAPAVTPALGVGLTVLVIFGALGNAATHPAANLGLIESVQGPKQGFAFGLKQAALPATTLVAGLSVPILSGSGVWRWAFIGAAGLAVCLIFLTVTRSRSSAPIQTAQMLSGQTRQYPQPTAVQRRSTKTLAAAFGFGTFTTMCLGAFTVTYTVELGHSASFGGLLLAAVSLLGVIARIGVGVFADKVWPQHLLVVALMMFAGSAGIIMMAVNGPSFLLVLGTLIAFGLGWSWNGVFHFSAIHYTGLSPASVTGIMQTTMSLGAMTGPILFGIIAQHSYQWAWALCAVMLMAAGILILHARRILAA
jgi:MFS family permease